MKTCNKNTVNNAGKKLSRITLADQQDITVISSLHGRLKKCAMKQVNVNMNAEKVESIDASTLQLLLSFVRQIQNNGNTVNWQSPSQVLLNSARQIGLQEKLLLLQVTEDLSHES